MFLQGCPVAAGGAAPLKPLGSMVRPPLSDCLGLRALLPAATSSSSPLPPAACYPASALPGCCSRPSSPHGPSCVPQAAITAISQQSRFHTETLETSSRDVDLRGVTLAVGDSELLADAHLRLTAGQRYGLIGRCDTHWWRLQCGSC